MKQNKYYQQFVEHCCLEKTLSAKTIKAYSIDLKQFEIFLTHEGILDVVSVDKTILKKYVHELQTKYKIKTVKRKVATLKTFFNYLIYEDFIEVSPFHKLKLRLKASFTLPTVLNNEEINELLVNLNNAFMCSVGRSEYQYYSALRDKIIVELLLNTGLRVSELCNLKVKDICLVSNYIRVHGKGKKQRQVYIVAPHLVLYLKELNDFYNSLQCDRVYFFLNKRKNRFSEQSVRNIVAKYSSGENKKITPHVLRHTFATILLEEGVDIVNIQHLLGHHSIVVTQIYTHINMKKQRELLGDKLPIDRLTISNTG